ncbi:MAG TPA: aminopeptidase P family protein [Saprospiraceae bacterium]|nr:aminopeptidase P family protein [Saprospiraceae bacterium]
MFDKKVYKDRRDVLRSKIKSGIAIFPGNINVPYNYPANPYRFRQDSSFLYYFGLNMPGLTAIIDFDNDKDYIFGNDVSIEDIIWMGPQLAIKDLAEKVAVDNTMPTEKLESFIEAAKNKGRKIHFLPPYRYQTKLFLQELTGIPAKETSAQASIELIKAVVDMRLIKDKHEIEYLDKIMAIGYEMHVSAMIMAKEGVYEKEIVGVMEGVAGGYGGHVSFPIILSKRGEILHNENHENLLKNGDLLLVDAGFDSPMGYATDHTRTFAVGGEFSDLQKSIYNIVIAANDSVHEASEPGIKYKEMHLLACKVIAQGLKDMGIMKGNVEDAVAQGAHALFMPHGLGHAMGLDVHDMEGLGEDFVGYGEELKRSDQFGTAYLRFARTLKPGHVVTNEPGIYFIPDLIDKWRTEGLHKEFINYDEVDKFRKFGGVRLEDDILITENGSRNLGKNRIPIYLEELSEIIGKG